MSEWREIGTPPTEFTSKSIEGTFGPQPAIPSEGILSPDIGAGRVNSLRVHTPEHHGTHAAVSDSAPDHRRLGSAAQHSATTERTGDSGAGSVDETQHSEPDATKRIGEIRTTLSSTAPGSGILEAKPRPGEVTQTKRVASDAERGQHTPDREAAISEVKEEERYITVEELLELAARKQAERAQSGKEWKKAKPDSVEAQIAATKGPFLEVGGPSQHLHEPPVINFDVIDKPLITSTAVGAEHNVQVGLWRSPIFGDMFSTERPKGWRGKTYRLIGQEDARIDPYYPDPVKTEVDTHVDATHMPEGSGYLGGLYAKALPRDVEGPFVTSEAPRALEQGGILVIESVDPKSLEDLKGSPYFDVAKVKQSGNKTSVIARRNDVPLQNE